MFELRASMLRHAATLGLGLEAIGVDVGSRPGSRDAPPAAGRRASGAVQGPQPFRKIEPRHAAGLGKRRMSAMYGGPAMGSWARTKTSITKALYGESLLNVGGASGVGDAYFERRGNAWQPAGFTRPAYVGWRQSRRLSGVQRHRAHDMGVDSSAVCKPAALSGTSSIPDLDFC